MPKERLEDLMTVRFKEGTFDRIDAVAGKNRRAKWIRKIVEDQLERAEKAKMTKTRHKLED